jgi:cytochrome c oxidase subunit 2
MYAQVQLMPEQASVVAGQVDGLFWFITGVCVIFTVLIATLIIRYAVKYRRRPGDGTPRPIYGSLRLELVWTIIPAVIGLVIFFWGARVYFDVSRPPDDAMEIYVVGKQWMWKVQHPEGQREINELHVPLGRPVKLNMISEDVIHSFYVPAFRMKQDVLPGRYTTAWFTATKTGTYRLYCAEYCGTEHSRMKGWVHVMEQSEYEAWLKSRAEGSLALQGEKLFKKLKCISCHARGGQNLAPLLEDVADSDVRLDSGKVVRANDDYLRESILNPRAKIVAGYQPVMPTFKGQVSLEEVRALIAFIRTLGPGDTPPRVEQTPPPVDESKEQGGSKP